MITQFGQIRKVETLDIHDGVVVVPEGITEIGGRAFEGVKVPSITIPNKIGVVKMGAFTGSEIETVTLPESVEVIEVGAFDESKIKRVTFRNGDLQLRSEMFQACHDLREIVLGKEWLKVVYWDGTVYVLGEAKRHDIYQITTARKLEERRNGGSEGLYFFAFKDKAWGLAKDLKRAIAVCSENYVTKDLKKEYEDLTLESKITAVDFRKITGSCDDGVEAWLKERGYDWSTTLTVEELLSIFEKEKASGTYGVKDFQQFVLDRYHDRAKARLGPITTVIKDLKKGV